jgi:hypothetical protein
MTDFLHELKNAIRDEAVAVNDVLANDGCKDYAEYRNLTGMLKGFGIAEQKIDEMIKRIEEN